MHSVYENTPSDTTSSAASSWSLIDGVNHLMGQPSHYFSRMTPSASHTLFGVS